MVFPFLSLSALAAAQQPSCFFAGEAGFCVASEQDCSTGLRLAQLADCPASGSLCCLPGLDATEGRFDVPDGEQLPCTYQNDAGQCVPTGAACDALFTAGSGAFPGPSAECAAASDGQAGCCVAPGLVRPSPAAETAMAEGRVSCVVESTDEFDGGRGLCRRRGDCSDEGSISLFTRVPECGGMYGDFGCCYARAAVPTSRLRNTLWPGGRDPPGSTAKSRDAVLAVGERLHREVLAAGVEWGSPLFIRTFKRENVMEFWSARTRNDRTGEPYTLLKTYEICSVSGDLGPKLEQGDFQQPEGMYQMTLQPYTSYFLALAVDYPNRIDPVLHKGSVRSRGGLIRVHGICGSAGCLAMDNGIMSEIYALVESAKLWSGQNSVSALMLPFRFIPAHMNEFLGGEYECRHHERKDLCNYDSFWLDKLEPMYRAWELSKRPFSASTLTYAISGGPADDGSRALPGMAPPAPRAVCGTAAPLENWDTMLTKWPFQHNYDGINRWATLSHSSGWRLSHGDDLPTPRYREQGYAVSASMTLFHDPGSVSGFHAKFRTGSERYGEFLRSDPIPAGADAWLADDGAVSFAAHVDGTGAHVAVGVSIEGAPMRWTPWQLVPAGGPHTVWAHAREFPGGLTPGRVTRIGLRLNFPVGDGTLFAVESGREDYAFLRKRELRSGPWVICSGLEPDWNKYAEQLAIDLPAGDNSGQARLDNGADAGSEGLSSAAVIGLSVGGAVLALCCLAAAASVCFVALMRIRKHGRRNRVHGRSNPSVRMSSGKSASRQWSRRATADAPRVRL